ncbi:MAG TPA: hypothetical protein VGO47_05565, partial [Chlamydiales bacterium]|nr:hypothetical protein [Chlamydiales bacterium]
TKQQMTTVSVSSISVFGERTTAYGWFLGHPPYGDNRAALELSSRKAYYAAFSQPLCDGYPKVGSKRH